MFGCPGSLLLRGVSLAAGAGATLVRVCRLLCGTSLVVGTGSRGPCFSSCGAWAQWLRLPGSRALAQ